MSDTDYTQIQIQRARELLVIYSARLHEQLKKDALYGVSVDPSITLEIEQLTQQVAQLQDEIKQLEQSASSSVNLNNNQPNNLVRAIIAGLNQAQKLTQETPSEDRPEKYRGLILLIGIGRPGEDPMNQSAGDAINYHLSLNKRDTGLEYCWLIASEGPEGSEPVAEKIKVACEKLAVRAKICLIGDPFDPQHTYDVVQRIYWKDVPEAGLRQEDVIADFTGGVKPMSVGMLLACGARRAMEYFTGRKKGVPSIPRIIRFIPWSNEPVV